MTESPVAPLSAFFLGEGFLHLPPKAWSTTHPPHRPQPPPAPAPPLIPVCLLPILGLRRGWPSPAPGPAAAPGAAGSVWAAPGGALKGSWA